MVNVFSNSVGAAIVSTLCEENLLRNVDDNPNEGVDAPNDYCEAHLLDYEAALGRLNVKNSPVIPLSANIRSQLQATQSLTNGHAFAANRPNISSTAPHHHLATSYPPSIVHSDPRPSENSEDNGNESDCDSRICIEETIVIQF